MSFHADNEKFIELLNQEYQWPARYTFKFIVKTAFQQDVNNLFDQEAEIVARPSRGDKYVSVTIRAEMQDAAAIAAIYESAAGIPGIISL